MKDLLPLRAGLAALIALLGGCSGGGGGGGTSGTTSFQLVQSSLSEGAVWPINQEMVFEFSEPVDFSTVSANTVAIRSSENVPATGSFRLADPFTLVFQPTCPTREDLSDAGLQPGEVYFLRMPGRDTAANVLRSVGGVPLGVQQQRTFSTPVSTQPSVVFRDVRLGPPAPVERDHDSEEPNTTHLELAGDPSRRVYFERDENGDPSLDPDFGDPDAEAEFLARGAPLNLYSDPSSRVAVLVAFDQPVSPSTTNIDPTRVHLEFRDNLGGWVGIATRVALQQNCTETGATLRLEPIGVLPVASAFRVVVEAGFQDIVGEASLVPQEFAETATRAVEFTSLSSELLSDEYQESFDFGGDSPRSFQDSETLFDSPIAEWGGGRLTSAFSFDGTGGPGGTFDWIVRAGESPFFDTARQAIVGGPDGVPTAVQNCLNGRVDVRNFIIEAGAEVRVQGPNPMRVFATGEVRIEGRFDLSGFAAKDVATLNTGNQVEQGGSGAGGGGDGGVANPSTTGPSPRGGNGRGPFGQANLGGQGGELGWSTNPEKDARRPGGGGGGRFARDWIGTTMLAPLSLAAGPGNNGNEQSIGALSRRSPAAGGEPGRGPFVDSSDQNDFFGVRPIVEAGQLTGLVRGELPDIWAGYGGGGGGNAGLIFPNPNWGFGSDEKGGGGGGGAGGLHIKALGRIVFGPTGQILANGARGGTGENANLLEHVGGTGGGGSGGHVILESTAQVDFTAGGAAAGAPIRDAILAAGPRLRQGDVNDVGMCCRANSNGGPGGAGLVQIHVQDPTAPPSTSLADDLVLPTSAFTLTDPLDGVSSPPALVMVPSFGKRSKARSDWISIGGADQEPSPGAPEGLVRFLFDGIETSGPDEGKIRRNGSFAADLAPLVETLDLAADPDVALLPDGFTVQFRGSALAELRSGSTSGISNDVYLRTPALLEDCAVRLFVVEVPNEVRTFTIVAATYDEGDPPLGDEALRVTVTAELGPLTDFNTDPVLGTTALRLVPRFFQVTTGGLEDALPLSSFVRLRFQAARANPLGQPDETDPLTDPPWTSDLALFNQLTPGELQFFRYEVEFDLDAEDEGITADTLPVNLEFLKIPFVF
jgi:hypothetical protein